MGSPRFANQSGEIYPPLIWLKKYSDFDGVLAAGGVGSTITIVALAPKKLFGQRHSVRPKDE